MLKKHKQYIVKNWDLQNFSQDFEACNDNDFTKFNFINRGVNILAMGKRKLRAEDVKRSIFPQDFYSGELSGAKIKNLGWNNGGFCPFHDDSKPGSFHVNLSHGGYHCFACGARGGDIIEFTMALYGLSFSDALKKLIRDWGLA